MLYPHRSTVKKVD